MLVEQVQDLVPGGGQPEGKEPRSQGPLGGSVFLRPAAAPLEKGAEASGDLPHCSRVRLGKALATEGFAVKKDMKEINAVGTIS